MYAPIIGSKLFLRFLAELDRDLAAITQAKRCRYCAAALDVSDYERKPRGGPRDLPDECKRRRSLCCRRDGCRTRHTPPSLVFLDRRVYLGVVVVLLAALADGATPRRRKTLQAMIGASAPTIARWQTWWAEVFPTSPTWKAARAFFAGGIDTARLPRSLLERWPDDALVVRVLHVLRLLSGEHDP